MLDEEFYADDTLGGRLIAARESAKISLETAAKRLGVAPHTLRNWECDRCEPSLERLVRLAGILDVRPIWLISGGWRRDCTQTGRNATDHALDINRVGAGRHRLSEADGAASRFGRIGLTPSGRTLQ